MTKKYIYSRIRDMKNNATRIFKLFIVNIFTVFRLICAFVLPYIYIEYGSGISALWTIGLFLTDAIDGFLARVLKSSTFFGSAMDALSDKVLNAISFILLGLHNTIMVPPLILEIAILLTIYSTYRYGGNIQSSITGKIKTVILDVCVIGSFTLLSLPALKLTDSTTLYLISNTPYYITLLGCICTISGIIALIDYKKKNTIASKDLNNVKVKDLDRKRKNFKEVINDLFDTKYYLKHKNEPILLQFYKIKN